MRATAYSQLDRLALAARAGKRKEVTTRSFNLSAVNTQRCIQARVRGALAFTASGR